MQGPQDSGESDSDGDDDNSNGGGSDTEVGLILAACLGLACGIVSPGEHSDSARLTDIRFQLYVENDAYTAASTHVSQTKPCLFTLNILCVTFKILPADQQGRQGQAE